ncbi:GNAT family N-acetyltransferase [Thiolinea disciformis]|uniref:GNAT family N-acetyltransferase n=1 Tax=Thiolinea disciformis TaxID=125614 RepID=UPI000376F0A6|nr:GNAT family N-acetyltransferase [Thiolinea disciformis]
MAITLQTVTGNNLARYIQDLARLRMEVFRAFPYLYDGSLEYEAHYLETYLRCPDAAMILVFDQDQVVGASSCIPLRAEDEAFQKPLRAAGFALDTIFYCGESVLAQAYRGQGLGVAFFREREAHAARLGGFTHSCFCAVDRPLNHPLRPMDYVPLDQFWTKRGYVKQSHLVARLSWQDIDQPLPTEKTLTYWMKTLV